MEAHRCPPAAVAAGHLTLGSVAQRENVQIGRGRVGAQGRKWAAGVAVDRGVAAHFNLPEAEKRRLGCGLEDRMFGCQLALYVMFKSLWEKKKKSK